jgi:aldehyde dehydrogenase (NAD+)
MSRVGGILVNGQERPAAGGATFAVFAPETGARLGVAARGTAEDVDRAVGAARRGFDVWRALPAKARERILLRAADILETQGEARFLDLLIDESGSTITKARGEIAYAPDLLRAAAGEARRLTGETLPHDKADRLSLVVREPVGVVGVLSPYNAPLSLLTKMTVFALAAGNAIVVKPSEETPLVALEFARVLLEAGLPEGAVAVVTGLGAEAGAALVEHPGVDALALTGSTETGRHVASAAGRRLRRVQLELGGKSALLVMADQDPAHAARIAAAGIFTHAGQICMANSRVIVEAPLFDAFVDAFRAVAAGLHLGDLRDPATIHGPLINARAVEKAAAHVAGAVEAGARLAHGGGTVRGLTFAPTLLLDTPRHAPAWRDESFAPIVNVVPARDLDHAIELANDSAYGLSAGVLTRDVGAAFAAARRIRAGSVHIGDHPFHSNALAPIGGYGDSGVGRSGGRHSVEEFTEVKWITVPSGPP